MGRSYPVLSELTGCNGHAIGQTLGVRLHWNL